jgi:small GTP-binding protein
MNNNNKIKFDDIECATDELLDINLDDDTLHNHMFKLVIVGESEVGKTSLINKIINNRFSDIHIPTIGADLNILSRSVKGKLIKMQIFDSSGSARFRGTVSLYYNHADVIIIVFDVCNSKTFEKLTDWITETKLNTRGTPEIIIVGNKVDKIEDREITYECAKKFCDKNGVKYFETSAYDKTSIDKIFIIISENLFNVINLQNNNTISINTTKSCINSKCY